MTELPPEGSAPKRRRAPRPANTAPLESFAPELIELLLKGGKERIVLSAPGNPGDEVFAAALSNFRNLRKRLHALRSRMKEIGDERANSLYRCEIKIDFRSGVMTLEPKDSRFSDLFSSAGIKPPEVSDDFLSTLGVKHISEEEK